MKTTTREEVGILAAKNWLFDNDFLEIPDALPPNTNAHLHGVCSAEAFTEALIRIETEQSIATSSAKETMYNLVLWRDVIPASRQILLFVPQGMHQTAKELLGLYDEIIEFTV